MSALDMERRQGEQAKRLDELLLANSHLGYSGFGLGNDWPACRYDEVWRCTVWLSGINARTQRSGVSSYWLKHVIEDATKGYISNGSMIAAAALLGIPVNRYSNSLNAAIGIPKTHVMAAIRISKESATLRDLMLLEPRLKALSAAAREYKRGAKASGLVCANARWYGYFEWEGKGLRKPLTGLVGWTAQNHLLRSSHAYDVAYKRIYAMLPHCKGCTCL